MLAELKHILIGDPEFLESLPVILNDDGNGEVKDKTDTKETPEVKYIDDEEEEIITFRCEIIVTKMNPN